MLVGFSGACNSGKTTLAKELAEELKKKGYDVALVDEVVREVFEKYRRSYGFESLEKLRKSDKHFLFQFDVLKAQIEKENVALDEADLVLSDRTIYDNLFYTVFWNSMDWKTLREYVSLFRSLGNRRYDLVFLCRPLRNCEKDGFRDYDLNCVEIQDLVIELLVDRENVVEVPDIGLNERVKFCLEKLRNYLD